MSKLTSFKRLASATALAAIASVLVVAVAAAQAPPNPPSRFVGSVTVDGAPATAGTLIEARIGSSTCGSTTVFMASGQARYTLDSPALDPAQSPNCGTDGATVTFYVAGKQAAQSGSWANYKLNTVDLAVSAAAASPTAAPTTPPATPAAPVAGNTASGGASSASLLELMIVASAIGLAGVALASRARKS